MNRLRHVALAVSLGALALTGCTTGSTDDDAAGTTTTKAEADGSPSPSRPPSARPPSTRRPPGSRPWAGATRTRPWRWAWSPSAPPS